MELKSVVANMTIGRKLNLVVLLSLGLAIFIVSAGVLWYDRISFTETMTTNVQTLAEVTAANSKAALTFAQPDSGEKILAALAAEPDVMLACLYDSSGRTFATYLRPGVSLRDVPAAPRGTERVATAGYLEVSREIWSESGRIGTILVRFSTQKMQARWINFLGIVVLAGLTGMVLAAVISATLLKGIVQYLGVAMHVVQKVATGDLSTQVQVPSRDEIGQLMAAARTMTESLSSLIGKVKHTCIQITSSTTRIAASSKDLEATSTEQAASTNEVVSTAREISSTSQELVSTMVEVAGMSEETATSADSGHQGLVHMEEVMQRLEEATASISAKLAAINQKAGEITTVVTTINKVADQTNLLSLNAAIEAEKAGEYGLGFGVVAREIRRLADQTAVATLDIAKVVGEMRSAVSAGVMGMEKFSEEVRLGVEEVRNVGTQFAQIIDRIQALTPRFEAVRQGMEAQSMGAAQISDAMVQLGDSASHIADAVRDTNRAVEELKASARVLQDEISAFHVS